MATFERATAASWEAILAEVDYCPWPGPRPLSGDDKDRLSLLVGRAEDIRRVGQEVDQDVRLILLAGESGVGKSSLLRAGMVPDLRKRGYQVAICDDWSGLGGTAAAFLAEKVEVALKRYKVGSPVDGTPLRDDGQGGLFWNLHDLWGGRVIIVLDQFEELVRHTPSLAQSVFDLLLALNSQTRIKLILSFRSEYLYALRRLEKEAAPFTISSYILSEIDPSFAEDVALAGNMTVKALPGGEAAMAIEPLAATRLAEAWVAARNEARESKMEDDPFGRIGLLHLQAALYRLHDDAKKGLVTKGQVEDLIESSRDDARQTESQSAQSTHARLFTRSLVRAVAVKLDRCREASARMHLDRYLVDGTAATVAAIAPHLSSAGYKLIREAEELVGRALGEQMQSLRLGAAESGADSGTGTQGDRAISDEQFRCLFDLLVDGARPAWEERDSRASRVDQLADSRLTIAEAADRRLGELGVDPTTSVAWADRFHPGDAPWVCDPKDVTCGPLWGRAPAEVLVEELRRYGFALTWLERSALVRVTSDGRDRMMISLIHDGFGQALREWATGVAGGLGDPSGALAAITTRRGPEYIWQIRKIDGDEPRHADFRGEPGAPRVFPNLSWQGGLVRAAFSNVVFVNCDFRGTFFSECVFRGVMFVNCLMDGVMFSDSKVLGWLSAYEEDWEAVEPTTVKDGKINRGQKRKRERKREPGRVPEFLVEVDPSLALTIESYRGSVGNALPSLPSGNPCLHSGVPGLAATPYHGIPTDFTPMKAESGGLVIYGGRVSSVVFRNMEIEGGADDQTGSGIALRHVAGSGLDFVESMDVSVDIFASAIRNLTITPDVSALMRGSTRGRVKIGARGSKLFQVWVSDGLEGTVTVDDCSLIQVWNGAGELDFGATGESKFFNLVGVKVDDSCVEVGGHGAIEVASDDLRDFGINQSMDYRRNPAKSIGEAPGSAAGSTAAS